MLIPFQCPSCKTEEIIDVISIETQPVCIKCKEWFMEPWIGDRYDRYKKPKVSTD